MKRFTKDIDYDKCQSNVEKKLSTSFTGKETEQCCSNVSIYEIVYYIGKKWLVCNECLEIDYFKLDIKEKVRIRK